ncbi:Na(+)-translocating NADH-quinone reductase subunit C [Marinobacter sp.]|uniref:Na(+)-translocating NADH-quinone reductase subunit C n=1 Tax=Marinobacter sp. TaxID=50741 RepID=UPI002B27A7C7|nr:Na(+)-translocating NADH-quinone reductase subunit C [Marinobacter sp.]
MPKKSIDSGGSKEAEGIWGRAKRKMAALPIDSTPKALLVAGVIGLICGYLVTSSNVLLKPRYLANQEWDQQKSLLDMVRSQPGMQELFEEVSAEHVKAHVIDLETGQHLQAIDPNEFDQRAAAKLPDQSIEIAVDKDLAKIKRREKYAKVYLVSKDREIKMIILPVYGSGYASTLYGYLGLAADANTVVGLTFYEHAETPGLGARVGDAKWLQQWQGKQVRDSEGEIRIGVARGQVPASSPSAVYEVDGLSGATRTSRSVTGLLRYWLGDDGFGPYLSTLRPPEPE